MQVSSLGRELLGQIASTRSPQLQHTGTATPLDPAFVAEARGLLAGAKQIVDELVVSSAYPIERLLNARLI